MFTSNDDPNLPFVTCSTQTTTRCLLLDRSIIRGDQMEERHIRTRSAAPLRRVVDPFGDAAYRPNSTAAHVGTLTTFALDSQVVSAPAIQEAIPGAAPRSPASSPPARPRTGQRAQVPIAAAVVRVLRSCNRSATLGLTSLRAGLIAGALGLALVLIYSLLYYRALGLLVAFSLTASGAMISRSWCCSVDTSATPSTWPASPV